MSAPQWNNKYFSPGATTPFSNKYIRAYNKPSAKGKQWSKDCGCFVWATLTYYKAPEAGALFVDHPICWNNLWYTSGKSTCVCVGMPETFDIWVNYPVSPKPPNMPFAETKTAGVPAWVLVYDDSNFRTWMKMVWEPGNGLCWQDAPAYTHHPQMCYIRQTNTGGVYPTGSPIWTPSDARFNLQDILLLPSWTDLIARLDSEGKQCCYNSDSMHLYMTQVGTVNTVSIGGGMVINVFAQCLTGPDANLSHECGEDP